VAAWQSLGRSAGKDRFTRHTCLQLGAEDYEVKPFDPTFLRKLARMVTPPDEPLAA